MGTTPTTNGSSSQGTASQETNRPSWQGLQIHKSGTIYDTFAMMCYENSEEEKYENGDDENKQESKNPEDDERKVDPGSTRNTEEPQETPLMQLYVSSIFKTGITNEWAMSTIEDNLATPRVSSSFRAWIESSKH